MKLKPETIKYILECQDSEVQFELIKLCHYDIGKFQELIKEKKDLQIAFLMDFIYNEIGDIKSPEYQQGYKTIGYDLINKSNFDSSCLQLAIRQSNNFNLVHILLLIKKSDLITGDILLEILEKMQKNQNLFNLNIVNAVTNHKLYKNDALLVMDSLKKHEN